MLENIQFKCLLKVWGREELNLKFENQLDLDIKEKKSVNESIRGENEKWR